MKIEAIRVGDSEPALLFTLIVGPSEGAREIGRLKEELAGRHHLRERFWDGLHDSGGHVYLDLGPEVKAGNTPIFGSLAHFDGAVRPGFADELEFWQAIGLFRLGRVDDAVAAFGGLASDRPVYVELLIRVAVVDPVADGLQDAWNL